MNKIEYKNHSIERSIDCSKEIQFNHQILTIQNVNQPVFLSFLEDGEYTIQIKGTVELFELIYGNHVIIHVEALDQSVDAEVYSFVLTKNNATIKHEVILRNENAKVMLHGLDITSSNEVHESAFDMIHEAPKSRGEMMLYGIAKDESSCKFQGTNSIPKGMKGSYSDQKIRGIVMNDKSHITAQPILLIDEYDCFAKHGATLGKISDEGLFYLMSRGISKAEALNLIVQGFIDPLIREVKETSVREEIIRSIDDKMAKRD